MNLFTIHHILQSDITPCRCGEEKSPGHFEECTETRAKLPSSLRPGKEREEMLGHKGHTELLAYLKAGSLYGSRHDDDDDDCFYERGCIY